MPRPDGAAAGRDSRRLPVFFFDPMSPTSNPGRCSGRQRPVLPREKLPYGRELLVGRADIHDGLPERQRLRTLAAIPADVRARDPDPRLLAVEDVQIAQVSADDI